MAGETLNNNNLIILWSKIILKASVNTKLTLSRRISSQNCMLHFPGSSQNLSDKEISNKITYFTHD